MDNNDLEGVFRDQGRAAAQNLSNLATTAYQEGFVGAVPAALASASYESSRGGSAPRTGATMRFVLKCVIAATAVATLAAVCRHQVAGEPIAEASRQAELSRMEAAAARELSVPRVVVTATRNSDGTVTPPTVGRGRIAIAPDLPLKVGTKLVASDGSLLGYLTSEDGTYGPTNPLTAPLKEGLKEGRTPAPDVPAPPATSSGTALVKN